MRVRVENGNENELGYVRIYFRGTGRKLIMLHSWQGIVCMYGMA